MRGIGADLVIADECFFLNPTAFVTGPVAMMLDGAVVLCGSSPNKGNLEIWNMLHETNASGQTMCEFVDYKMECPMCEEIRNKHIPDYICRHRMGMRPPHQTKENVEAAVAFTKSRGDMVSQEIFGSAAADVRRFFPEEAILKMENSIHNQNAEEAPKFIYASFDPSGASRKYQDGHTSDYAFITGYKSGNSWVVRHFLLHIFYITFCCCYYCFCCW